MRLRLIGLLLCLGGVVALAQVSPRYLLFKASEIPSIFAHGEDLVLDLLGLADVRFVDELPDLPPPPPPEPDPPPTWYASPTGSGDCTEENPCSLHTVLNSSFVQPGDQVLLYGGIYPDLYTSTISGSAERPIDVRPRIHHERVKFMNDARTNNSSKRYSLTIEGSHVRWWDLDFVSDRSPRLRDLPTGEEERPSAIRMRGHDHAIIHCNFFDLGYVWTEQRSQVPAPTGNELYGITSSWNGYGRLLDPVNTPTKIAAYGGVFIGSNASIRDSLILKYFQVAFDVSSNIRGYMELEGNVVSPAADIFYPGSVGRGPNLGRPNLLQTTVRDNIFYNSVRNQGVGGERCDIFDNWWLDSNPPATYQVVGLDCGELNGTGNIFWKASTAQWKTKPAVDSPDLSVPGPSGNTFLLSPPAQTMVRVRPTTKYQEKRGQITVVNWEDLPSVDVDLSSIGFEIGDPIQIRDPLNFKAHLVDTVYTGAPVTIPLTNLPVRQPAGSDLLQVSHTAPRFAAFVTCMGHHQP